MARTAVLVTATEYGVSQTSGDGIAGVLLDVYRNVTENGKTRTVFAVHNMPFPNGDAADAYALEHGWLKVYTPRKE